MTIETSVYLAVGRACAAAVLGVCLAGCGDIRASCVPGPPIEVTSSDCGAGERPACDDDGRFEILYVCNTSGQVECFDGKTLVCAPETEL